MTSLTPNIILQLYEKRADGVHPFVIQINNIKEMTKTAQQRYRLIISDGTNYMQALLATQRSHLITEGQLKELSVVRVTESMISEVHNQRLVVILNLEVLSNPGKMIGQPRSVKEATQMGAGSSRNIPQQPMRQQPPQPQPPQQPMRQQPQHQPQPQPQRRPQPAMQQSRPQYQQQQQQQHHHQISDDEPEFHPELGAIHPIAALTPYQKSWTVKARVMKKSPVRTWNKPNSSGKFFHVDLVDSKGGVIRAALFNKAVDAFEDVLQEENIYYISKGTIKPANKKFNPNAEYEMYIEDRSIVIPAQEDDSTIPSIQFNFMPIDSLAGVDNNTILDTIGIVTQVGQVSTVQFKNKEGSANRKVLKLIDTSSHSVELTLWAEAANKEINEGDIVALKDVRKGDFNGVSLSTMRTSTVMINPDIGEAEQLRQWYSENQGNVQEHALSKRRETKSSGASTLLKATLSQLHAMRDILMDTDKAPVFWVAATVTYIKPDGTLYYPACPNENCRKKMNDTGNGFECLNCGHQGDPIYRYVLFLNISDHTASAGCSAFGQAAETIMQGVPADDIAHSDDESSKRDLECRTKAYKEYLFRIRVKMDHSSDEPKLKMTIIKAMPSQPDKSSKALLREIQQQLQVSG